MGRRAKIKGNPDLAEAHAAGATVTILQMLVHTPNGIIDYPKSRMWCFHLALAIESFQDLEALHEDVLRIPVDKTNSRRDDELLKRIYGAGSSMVSNSVRTVQHMAQEIESDHQTRLVGQTLEDRIKEAGLLIGLTDTSAVPGYDGLIEISKVRDALEHPKDSNVYQAEAGRWDEVPLAWLISERSIEAFKRFIQWTESFINQIDSARAAAPARTVTLNVVRGIESLHQAKKPPRERPN